MVAFIIGYKAKSNAVQTDQMESFMHASLYVNALIAGIIEKKRLDQERLWDRMQLRASSHSFQWWFNIILVGLGLLYASREAMKRISNPRIVDGELMLFGSIFGLAASVIAFFVLKKSKEKHGEGWIGAERHGWLSFCNIADIAITIVIMVCAVFFMIIDGNSYFTKGSWAFAVALRLDSILTIVVIFFVVREARKVFFGEKHKLSNGCAHN